MTKILYYDCFSGISGDMHLGAMLDLGVPETYLRSELDRLDLADEFELLVEKDAKQGISGTKATVRLVHTDDHHHHHHHPHAHRTYVDIRDLIRATSYSEQVKALAINIFHVLAVAEAKIHNTTVDAVHFHEVGATDAIVDIVGAAICLDYLILEQQIDRIMAATVELGSGFVWCAHGTFPVPAPATLAILQGVPCHRGRVDSEATTPTGAAILKAVVDEFHDDTQFVIEKIGYGLGQKEFSIPNVLRVILGRVMAVEMPSPATGGSVFYVTRCIEMEANIDDMNPEAYEPLMQALFEAGADDVYFTPISMKKSRPGTKISILGSHASIDKFTDILFNHSTTLGIRIYEFQKRMLHRELLAVQTPYGDIHVKRVRTPNGETRWKSEYEAVKALAQKEGVDYITMKARVDLAVGQRLKMEEEAE